MVKFRNFLFISIFCAFSAGCQQSSDVKKVGIIVPIEVKALDEIVAGFESSLQKQSPYPLEFKVANAQSDMNMERAIVQQMQAANYDIIAPIGTDATEMTATMIKNRPIVSLAASYSEQDRKQRKPCNIAVVHDEIPPATSIQFLHEVYPQLTQLVLIHSASDKIFPQVKETIAAGKKYGIVVKAMMAPTLNDIYSVANNIPTDTQAIFVLKDTMIVNGIATLEMAAAKRHIPLYTSDQGSVQDGAAFSLGVHEREIGEDGGRLAAQILSGTPACALPIVEMTKLTVFINKDAVAKEGQSLDVLQNVAGKQHFQVEIVSNKGGG